MKHWRDLTVDEKLDRLASLMWIAQKNITELRKHTHCGEIPGYDVMYIETTPKGDDAWLGVYGGAFDE